MSKQPTSAAKVKQPWTPPRGIRFIPIPNRPNRPFGCQYRVDGKRKTATFTSATAREEFARQLVGDLKRDGVEALRFTAGEVREWRAFRAMVGNDVDLAVVARHWLATGTRCDLTMAAAANLYLESTKRGRSELAHSHYRKWIGRLVSYLGERPVAGVTREDVEAWIASLELEKFAPDTLRGHYSKANGLFHWLVTTRKLAANPCDGVVPPKIVRKEVQFYSVAECTAWFKESVDQPDARELLGRLALEAFCGIRNDSAGKLAGADIKFDLKGIVLLARNIKTERREFIDGLPDNLWRWLAWSKPSEWTMTPRQYLAAKSSARVRAKVREVHNGFRHGFASHHVAAYKDPGRTSVILCHSSPARLWRDYKGNATEAEGRAWFSILPPVK